MEILGKVLEPAKFLLIISSFQTGACELYLTFREEESKVG